MKMNITKKIVYGLAIVSLVLPFGGLAIAHNAPDDCINGPGIPPREDHRPSPKDMKQHLHMMLDQLVTKNTITKDQADKILHFFNEKDAQRKTDMDLIRKMTPEDREAHFKQHPPKFPDLDKELKNAADLSDEQVKAVLHALRPPQKLGPDDPKCPEFNSPQNDK